jgi:hypothetical protein
MLISQNSKFKQKIQLSIPNYQGNWFWREREREREFTESESELTALGGRRFKLNQWDLTVTTIYDLYGTRSLCDLGDFNDEGKWKRGTVTKWVSEKAIKQSIGHSFPFPECWRGIFVRNITFKNFDYADNADEERGLMG